MELALKDLVDRDWDQIARGLRLLVLRSGFTDWDRDFMANLDEAGMRPASNELVAIYAESFARFIEIRTEERLNSMQSRFTRALGHEGATTAVSVVMVDVDREVSIFENPVSNDLVEELKVFAKAARDRLAYDIGGDGPTSTSTLPEPF